MDEAERVLLIFKRILNTASNEKHRCPYTYFCKNPPGLPTMDSFEGYDKVRLEDCDNDFLSFMTGYLAKPESRGW